MTPELQKIADRLKELLEDVPPAPWEFVTTAHEPESGVFGGEIQMWSMSEEEDGDTQLIDLILVNELQEAFGKEEAELVCLLRNNAASLLAALTETAEVERLVVRTERGWPGHFIGATDCVYRRNTLLECEDRRVVVSTVGNHRTQANPSAPSTIGFRRYYETMAFPATWDGHYWDAVTGEQMPFDSDWSICAGSPEGLPADADSRADAMHEAVVAELAEYLRSSPPTALDAQEK